MNENAEESVGSGSHENSVSVEYQNEVKNTASDQDVDGQNNTSYYRTDGYNQNASPQTPTTDSSYDRGYQGQYNSPGYDGYNMNSYYNNGPNDGGYQHAQQHNNYGYYSPNYNPSTGYYTSGGKGYYNNRKQYHHVPARSPTSTPPVTPTPTKIDHLSEEDFEKQDVEKKMNIVFSKLGEMTSMLNTLAKSMSSLEDRIGKLDYWLNDTDIRTNRLDYRLNQNERSSAHNSNSLLRCHQRLDELSFLQNNRIAKSLKFGYRKKVEENLERNLGLKVRFHPCKIYEASDTFHHPRDCVKHLSGEFQVMRDFMNNLNTTSRSRLDKRKDTFLRLDSDHLFIPAISIDEEGRIVICRVTTSPLGFFNIQRLLRGFKKGDKNKGGYQQQQQHNNRRYNNNNNRNNQYKIHQFVQNSFYNLSVLEHQVAMIKNFEAAVVRVVFLYETSVDTYGNTYHNSLPLVEFLKGYPMEFRCLNALLKMKKLTMFSMKEMDTSRLKL